MIYHDQELSNIKHLLEQAKVENPYTQKPLSDALILGIGGGLDARYNVNDKAPGQSRELFISGRSYLLSKHPAYTRTILKRLGLPLEFNSLISIDKAKLRSAIQQGIHQHLENAWSASRQRWFLSGLEMWSHLILNNQHQHGWLRRYPEGKLYWAVRDAFKSIETRGKSGGFYRPLYSDFLDECTTLVSHPSEYRKAATHYRHIGNGWQTLAEMLLPDQMKLLKDTKILLREIQADIRHGQKPSPQIAKKLRRIDEQIIRNGFPWGMKRTRVWLEEIREQLNILIQMECEALAMLAKASR